MIVVASLNQELDMQIAFAAEGLHGFSFMVIVQCVGPNSNYQCLTATSESALGRDVLRQHREVSIGIRVCAGFLRRGKPTCQPVHDTYHTTRVATEQLPFLLCMLCLLIGLGQKVT